MNRLWQETITALEQTMPQQHFATWIKPIEFIEMDRETIRLGVTNRFCLDWIRQHYLTQIQETLNRIGGVQYRIEIRITSNKNQQATPVKQSAIKTETTNERPVHRHQIKTNGNGETASLNPKYTFEEFVSGPSNQFSYAAAMAVANNPATTYNPLFIYGGVGLGKTHLINAIGNAILASRPEMKVCYYTSEKFMNELINSLRYAKMDEFRRKFRSMDILLIDDVQFIAGKERTQEEFFHTFNSLYESHKQIVVTSDKFPKEIPGLEERLRSRFEWGLIADIQAPDVETKQAILKMKAEQNNIDIPEDVCLFLANSVSSNIRELEGYLVRIGAFASLTSTEVTLAMAKEVLRDILIDKTKEVTVEDILKAVAAHYNIKISEIRSPKRLKTLVLPRQVAMYLARQLTACSYPEIGSRFGGKDHSTIIHAVNKIEKQLEEDFQLRATVSTIKTGLIH